MYEYNYDGVFEIEILTEILISYFLEQKLKLKP